MDFSLILATRERVELLENLLKSVEDTSSLPLEVMAMADNDDQITLSRKEELEKRFPFFRLLSRERTNNLNNDYLNVLANMSTGRFVFVLNDDALMTTKDWDKLSIQYIEEYLKDKPDRLVMAMPADDLEDDFKRDQGVCFYSSFPIFTREAVNALGFVMPPRLQSWGADVAISTLYHVVGRAFYMPNVKVKHVCYHNNTRTRDHINAHVQSICNDGVIHLDETVNDTYVQRLFPNKKLAKDCNNCYIIVDR